MEEQTDIECAFFEFYKNLFKSEGNMVDHFVVDCVVEVITLEMNSWMMREVDMEEVKHVVFHLSQLKVLGPDYFDGLFFQKH